MKYGLGNPLKPFVMIVDLGKERFEAIPAATKSLLIVMGIEQKWDLLLENYADYERELLNISLESSLFPERAYERKRDHGQAVNRRLANLLTAARLYVDQTERDLAYVHGSAPSHIPDLIKQKRSQEYNARLGYRVMESLRNYMQHRGMPLRAILYSTSWNDDHTKLRFSVIPMLDVTGLADDQKFKRSVLQELRSKKTEIPITNLVREYIEGLGVAHQALRAALSDNVKIWDGLLKDAWVEAGRSAGTALEAVSVIRVEEDGETIISQLIAPELWEYRESLAAKNSFVESLAVRYVSSERVVGKGW